MSYFTLTVLFLFLLIWLQSKHTAKLEARIEQLERRAGIDEYGEPIEDDDDALFSKEFSDGERH